MEDPTVGTRAVCKQCNKPIVFVGPYWDHEGEMKPRHVAIPIEAAPAPLQAEYPAATLHWSENYGGRELQEIKFARTYHQRYGHGTPGHLHLLLISQLSRQIDILLGRDPNWDKEQW
jgi:hypothetical protein